MVVVLICPLFTRGGFFVLDNRPRSLIVSGHNLFIYLITRELSIRQPLVSIRQPLVFNMLSRMLFSVTNYVIIYV